MTLRQYLFLMIISTVMCWLGWLAVVRTVDPMGSGFLGIVIFYGCLGLSISGTLAVAGLAVRAALRRQEAVAKHAATSFRQGILLSVLVVAALIMQSHNLLSWRNILLSIGTLTIVEFLLICLRPGRGTPVQ